jgi:class 3 adenylate cyclase/predicted ATPase
MQQIADWLEKIGMSEYAERFAENDIDVEVLGELTDTDFDRLGVSIGHRRKLLKAVAAGLSTATDAPPTKSAAESAERRQVTVMFSDLVGSTVLSARMDPEDLREVISAYQKCVAETVQRFGGYVAKLLGDGVLIFFGYPQAHEDDAERAVRAGLQLVVAVGDLNTTHSPLQARVGIATGLVVVGDLVGSGEAQERGIVGETPNLAARLQGLAEPNSVVIAESTRALLGNLFELEDLGARSLKGVAGRVRAWTALRPTGVERFEALRTATTPLVGREEEGDLLLRRWEQTKRGDGCVVLISGEPGIGKSRLIVELAGRIEAEPQTRLRYFCSPYHQDTALYPTIVQLERAAGFARNDTVERRLGKLQALLAHGAYNAEEIALIAELLSLPSTAADLNLSPQRKREKLFEALLHRLEALAREKPVLMIFEDVHWLDPTSRELLDLTMDRARRVPVLLIVTFRLEFQPPWGDQPHVTMLRLNRLGGREGAALVHRLADNRLLPGEIVDEIVERTDGVPLFVEELTKVVLESGDRAAAMLQASPTAGVVIPATLQASLIARLDRLGTAAKEVAQVGAVLGREFSYELIEQVARRRDLNRALEQLTDAGLLFCRGTAPQSSYLFKHALVQDAAYGTLLRGRRQELHARVATTLERHFPDLIGTQPELLARHLTGAAEAERAVEQWLKAGQFAAVRLAHLEAIRHFDRGLALVGSLPESVARDRQEAELQLARGLSLFTTEGFISNAAAQAYARAHELAEKRADARQLFIAIYGRWQGSAGAGRVLEGRHLSTRLLGLTEGEVESGLRLQAHHTAWTTCLFGGEPAASREHCDAGRRLYDAERHRTHRLLFGGHDPSVCACNVAAQADWLLGYPAQALVSSSEGLALAERLAHPLSLELALFYRSGLHLYRGEPEPALRHLEALETLVAEQRLGFVHEPSFLRGPALLAQGKVAEGIVCLRDGLETQSGKGIWRVWSFTHLAEGLVRHGECTAALVALSAGLESMQATGERQWEAELHRIRGLALWSQDDLEESQAALERALAVAREQQAKSLELRAAMSMARLWRDQGKRDEARELLAPVYGWFTEGFETRDLKEARALLDELAT